MSTQEIIAELSNLNQSELEQVDAQLQLLLGNRNAARQRSWGATLLEMAGSAEDLPEDFAHNHDHYLHGAARS